MSYWPELRDSLMTAARREYEARSPKREPARPRGRRHWIALPKLSSVALVLATGTAIAVAVVALTVIRPHSQSSGSGLGRSSAAANDRGARKAAAAVLRQLVLPPGAVRSGLVPGTPADLWRRPSHMFQAPHRVDTFGVWRLPESPGRAIAFIEAHGPQGSSFGIGSESSSSAPTASGQPPSSAVIDSATVVFTFPGNARTVIWPELAVTVDRLPGGGSVLRADGEAAWLYPRSTADTIPAAVDRVHVTTLKQSPRHGRERRTTRVTYGPRIHRLIALLNALPAAVPSVARCNDHPGDRLLFRFYSPGRARPVAGATYLPFCNKVLLAIGERPPAIVQLGAPNDNFAKLVSEIRALTSFAAKLP